VEEGRQRRRAVVEVTDRCNGCLRLSEKRGALLLGGLRGRPWRAVLASLVGRPKEGALSWRGGAGLQVAAWRVARGEKGGGRGGPRPGDRRKRNGGKKEWKKKKEKREKKKEKRKMKIEKRKIGEEK
jgi:hypothetical protein